MKHAVVIIVERAEGEDSPADWDWGGVFRDGASIVEHVLTSEVLTHEHPTRVEVGNDAVWLTSDEEGTVTW